MPRTLNSVIRGNLNLPIYFEDSGELYQVNNKFDKDNKRVSSWLHQGKIKGLPEIKMNNLVVTPAH